MPSERKRSWVPTVAIVIVAGAIAAGAGFWLWRSAVADPVPSLGSRLDVSSLGDRILVVAPHPDDEIVNTGGLIAEARASGADVRVVLLTVGDGYRIAAQRIARGPVTSAAFLSLGEARAAESRAADAEVGLHAADIVYLAYPDGSLSELWDLSWDPAHPHQAANGERAIPYSFAFRPGSPYCGADLARDLTDVIRRYEPTAIVYPDASDFHPDHWAGGAFCDYALQQIGFSGTRLTYVTHQGIYPFPWLYEPGAFMRPPAGLRDVGLRWHSLPLSKTAEATKNRALDDFRSQMAIPHMRIYLHAFVRRNELLASYPVPTISRAESDAVPPAIGDAPSQDAVVEEPAASPAPPHMDPFTAIQDVRMVRGPSLLWIGIRTDPRARKDLTYLFGLRLFGEGAPARLDLSVTGDHAAPIRRAANSLMPSTVRVARSGRTVWIGVPSGILDGYRSCLVAGRTSAESRLIRRWRTMWRPVEL